MRLYANGRLRLSLAPKAQTGGLSYVGGLPRRLAQVAPHAPSCHAHFVIVSEAGFYNLFASSFANEVSMGAPPVSPAQCEWMHERDVLASRHSPQADAKETASGWWCCWVLYSRPSPHQWDEVASGGVGWAHERIRESVRQGIALDVLPYVAAEIEHFDGIVGMFEETAPPGDGEPVRWMPQIAAAC